MVSKLVAAGYRALELASNYDELMAFLTWPKFSFSSYRLVSGLVRQALKPATVIDVGANVGQFCVAAVKLFNPKKIYTFEPLPSAYLSLSKNIKSLTAVQHFNRALGEREGEIVFHVNSHSHSSSILPLAESHLSAFPDAVEREKIKVPLTTLDKALCDAELPKPCLLKLDVQGYEDKVLEGATETLQKVDYIVSELSFKPMYEGERVFTEMLALMDNYGFRFVRPLDFLRDPKTGEILQLDALFERIEESV